MVWSLRPINVEKMTHRLDKLLGMRAQLITAYEVSRAASDQAGAYANNPVIGQLVQDSVNVTINLRRQVKVFSRSFWLEIHALIAVAAILGAMLLFDAVRPEIPG